MTVLLTVSILMKGSYIEAFTTVTGFQPLPFVRSRERGKLGTGLYALILGSVLINVQSGWANVHNETDLESQDESVDSVCYDGDVDTDNNIVRICFI